MVLIETSYISGEREIIANAVNKNMLRLVTLYQIDGKGTTKFARMQANSEKIAICWIMDTHEGHWKAFRLLEMGRDSYGNPSVILYVTVG